MKLIYIIFIIISILTCLLAASRGAVVSLLIAVIFLIYLSFRKSLGKFLKVVLIFLSLILLTSSLWLPYTEQLIFKNQSRMQTDNLFSGRSRMWKDRIEDFKYSPIYGVGFSSLKNTSNSKISSLGFIEPGSGWLFILSSLGILGFIIFTKLIFKPIFSLSKKNDLKNKSYALIVSILIFFVFHLGIEGYVLSSGGFLFFYLWLTIAIAQKRSVFYLESSY
jgi:O-antigen ligase